MFPTEILENIFSQLPLTDLVSKALVCKHWNAVISREKVKRNVFKSPPLKKMSVNSDLFSVSYLEKELF